MCEGTSCWFLTQVVQPCSAEARTNQGFDCYACRCDGPQIALNIFNDVINRQLAKRLLNLWPKVQAEGRDQGCRQGAGV